VQLAKLFTVSESLGSAIGTLVHACFEQILWLDNEASVDLPTLRQAVINALTPDQLRHISLEKELANFLKLLQLTSVQKTLSRTRYESDRAGLVADEIVVENERRVSLILDDRLIDGSVDRLVILKKGGRPFAAEIVDYKTDHWDTRTALDQWIRERTNHHRPQLKAYAQVASRMLKLPLERIDTSLVLLAADAVVRCDDHAPPPPHLKYTQLHLAW
jgi:ATP-dependent exoDNAse (exonuclease V) beta subunit